MTTTLYLTPSLSGLGTGKLAALPWRGLASTTAITNTTASGTNIPVTATGGGTALSWWIQIDAVTISGTITANIRGLESSLSANAGAGILVDHYASDGTTLLGSLGETTVPGTITEYSTSDAAKVLAGVTPASTAFSAGDWLKITLKVRNVGTMGGPFTVTNSYGGPTAAAAGDTSVTFTEAIKPYSGGTNPNCLAVYPLHDGSALTTRNYAVNAITTGQGRVLTDTSYAGATNLITSVTGGGCTWQQLGSGHNDSGSDDSTLQIWEGIYNGSGNDTSVTVNSASFTLTGFLADFSNMGTALSSVTTAGADSGGGNSTSPSPGAITGGGDTKLAIMTMADISGTSPTTVSTNWVPFGPPSNSSHWAAFRISPASESPAFTVVSTQWNAYGAVLVPLHAYTQALSGGLSFTGAIKRSAARALAGVLSFVGGIVTNYTSGTTTHTQSLSAGLNFAGSRFAFTGRALPGGLSFSGSRVVQTGRALAATLTPVGSVLRAVAYILAGGLSFTGTRNARPARSLSGALSFTGSRSVSMAHSLPGGLSFGGSINRAGTRGLVAGLSFTGTTLKLGARALAGGLSFIGTRNVRPARALPGSLSFVGSRSTSTSHLLPGGLSFSGAIKRAGSRALTTGGLSFTGTTNKSAARALSGGLSFSGAISGTALKIRALTAGLSFTGSQNHAVSKKVAGGLSFVGSQSRAGARSLAGALSFSGVTNKGTMRSLGASGLSFSGSVSGGHIIRTALTAGLSFVGSQTRAVGHKVAGGLSFTGSTNKASSRSLSGALSFVGSMIKVRPLSLTGGLSFTGGFNRAFPYRVNGGLGFTGTTNKGRFIKLTGGLSFTGSIKKRAGKAIAGALSFVGSIIKLFDIPVLVQQVPFVETVLGSSHNITVMGVRGGSTLILEATAYASTTAVTGGGVTWVKAGENFDLGGDGSYVSIWYGFGAVAGNTTITYTTAGAHSTSAIFTEWAGISSQATVSYAANDTYVVGTGVVNSNTATVSIPTTLNTMLVISATADITGELPMNTGTFTALTPAGGGDDPVAVGSYLITPGVGTTTSTYLFPDSQQWNVDMVAFTTPISQVLIGALSFVGSQAKRTSHKMAGSLSPLGVIVRAYSRSLTAALALSGVLSKVSVRKFAAALGLTGSAAKQPQIPFTGALSPASGGNVLVGHQMSSTLQPAGLLNRLLSRAMASTLNFVSDLLNGHLNFTSFTAGISFVGSHVKTAGKATAGSLGLSGSMMRFTSHFEGAVLYFQGTKLSRGTVRSLSGAVSFSGSMRRGVSRALPGVLTPAGAVYRGLFYKIAAGLGFSGTLHRTWLLRFQGALHFVGDIQRHRAKILNGGLSLVGAVTKKSRRSLAGGLPLNGVLLKRSMRHLSGSLHHSGGISRVVRVPLTALLTLVGKRNQFIRVPLASTLQFTGSVTRRSRRALVAASLSFTGNVRRRSDKALAGYIQPAGRISRFLAKKLASTLHLAGIAGRGRTVSLLAGLGFHGLADKLRIKPTTVFYEPMGGVAYMPVETGNPITYSPVEGSGTVSYTPISEPNGFDRTSPIDSDS